MNALLERWVDPEIVEAIDSLPANELEVMPGYDPDRVRLTFSVARRLYRSFQHEASGLPRLPEGPALLVANHAGQFPIDALVVAVAVLLHASPPRLLRLLASERVASLTEPLRTAGIAPVGPEQGEALLRGGHAVLSFPEGLGSVSKVLGDRRRVRPFAAGPFALSLAAGAPVVPVAVVPSLPAVGALPYFPLPTRFRVVFGEPLPPDPGQGADGLAAEAHGRVQRLLDDALRGA